MNTPVNTLQPIEATEFDPFAAASNPDVATPNYDLFGLIELNAYGCALIKGQGKTPWEALTPEQQAANKRVTAIQMYVQPLPEIDVKYPKQWECDWIAEYQTWASVTLPSIKAQGFENVRDINGKWARIARVDSKDKPYDKKDANGNLTGEKAIKKTFKIIEIYDTEDACREAYIANGGKSAEAAAPVAYPADAEKTAALAFLKVIVTNATKGKTMSDNWKGAINTALTRYPTVAKFFNADSPEVMDMIGTFNLLQG